MFWFKIDYIWKLITVSKYSDVLKQKQYISLWELSWLRIGFEHSSDDECFD